MSYNNFDFNTRSNSYSGFDCYRATSYNGCSNTGNTYPFDLNNRASSSGPGFDCFKGQSSSKGQNSYENIFERKKWGEDFL